MEHHPINHQHHHHDLRNTQDHQAVHWNYSSPSATILSAPLTSTPVSNNIPSSINNTWTPPKTRSLKRAVSESDCDDIYSEESSKEQ